MPKTLKEIADAIGGTIVGNESVMIHNIRPIDEAGRGDLTFIANSKYRKKIYSTEASAILVSSDVDVPNKNLLIVQSPYMALAKALSLMYPQSHGPQGISGGAFIADSARIASGVTIYSGAYVGHEAVIESGTVLYPGVCVGQEAFIGSDSILYPNVTVYGRCRIGKRVVLHAGVVIGSDGFGFADPGAANLKVPQVGYVQIDDDVEIGANSTVDRGTLGRTWIQRGVKIDNLVQIAHNVVIGENSIIVAQVGISGSTRIGRSVIMGGQVGIAGHLSIGDRVMIAAKSGVHKDIAPNQVIAGTNQMPHQEWLRTQACIPKLPEMRKTVQSLTKKIEALERRLAQIEAED